MTRQKTKPDTLNKILIATKGTHFGAIIRRAYNVDQDLVPRFVGKAMLTSDEFIMCDFIDRNGEGHMGAFVGALSDLQNNVAGLIKHLSLTPKEAADFRGVISSWCTRGGDDVR